MNPNILGSILRTLIRTQGFLIRFLQYGVYRVWDNVGFRLTGVYRVWGSLRVQDLGLQGFRGAEFRVSGLDFEGSGFRA